DEDGHDHGDGGHDGHAPIRIDLVQNRVDLKAGVRQPVVFLDGINLRLAHNDYEHVEFEGTTPATRFSNRGFEGRLEAVQKAAAGWRGAFGLQFGRVDFGAVGEEAFVPSSRTGTLGLFA